MLGLRSVRRSQLLVAATAALAALVTLKLGDSVGYSLEWLSSQPSVRSVFEDTRFAYQDALIFLVSLVFLIPIAGLLALVLLIFAIALLGGVFLPVARRLALPDWCSTTLAVGAFAGAIYASQAVWLPPVLWVLGLVARAYLIVAS